ncbi:MAG: tetratricopeptide repeat protein, partial [Cyanobacteria bacterium]|nr:tetratricopeptide repeat protein [Cyanobacteriota bacterium]
EDRYQSVEEIHANLVTIQQLLPINKKALHSPVAKLKTVSVQSYQAPAPDPKVRELKRAIVGVSGLFIILVVALFSMPSWHHLSSTATNPAVTSTVSEPSEQQPKDDGQLLAKAINYMKSGEYSLAIPLLKYKVRVSKERGTVNGGLADNLQNLGECYFKTADLKKASSSYEEALSTYRALDPPESSHQHKCMIDYAKVLRKLNQTDEAEALEAEAKHLL